MQLLRIVNVKRDFFIKNIDFGENSESMRLDFDNIFKFFII